MRPSIIVLAALIAGTTALPAQADTPGRGWISEARVKALLAKQGYTVTKIEADDGHWEGEATKRGGGRFEFHVDPKTGKVTKMQPDRD